MHCEERLLEDVVAHVLVAAPDCPGKDGSARPDAMAGRLGEVLILLVAEQAAADVLILPHTDLAPEQQTTLCLVRVAGLHVQIQIQKLRKK